MTDPGHMYVNDRFLYVKVRLLGGELSEVEMFQEFFLVIPSNGQMLLVDLYFLFVK